MKPTEAEDTREYRHFATKSCLDKAMHVIEGLVRGIAADGVVSDVELKSLASWVSDHQQFIRHHPFNEIVPRLEVIIDQKIVDEEEVADILWLSSKFTTSNDYFDAVTSDMQRLQGILHGIVADGKITKEELLSLEEWMEEREHLKKCWPYDEIESLIVAVLADGVIDDEEHAALLRFFQEFTRTSSEKSVDPIAIEEGAKLSGVCAMCPEVEFEGKTFCFTGSSGTNTRKELAEMVADLGAKYSNSLTKKTDYLVVCSEGNQCWAYSCYGRKVERAVNLRKSGEPIMLIHETDFRDAIRDIE